MGILDFTAPAATAQTFARQGRRNGPRLDANGQPLPESKLWLNFGYTKNDKFISLPLGLAIDTMEPQVARGQNVEFNKQVAAQNGLLKALQDAGFKLEPGDTQPIVLECQLRRVNEKMEIADEDNEFAIDFSALMTKPDAAE